MTTSCRYPGARGWVYTAVAVCCVLFAPRVEAVSASGGNYTNDIPGYRIHVFTTDGTLDVLATGNAQVLVVGGGGGGGQRVGGGGGAGGVVYATNYNLTLGLKNITVGGGGAGATANSTRAGDGTNSVFDVSGGSGYTITANGGGGGSSYNFSGGSGRAGGSGGGGSYRDAPSSGSGPGGGATTGTWTGVTGTVGYGNAGGASYSGSGYGGGGGGGAGGLGGNASSTLGGGGGVGCYFPQFAGFVPSTANTPSDGWFAGGGGAGATSTTAGPGGLGGGASGKAGNNQGVSDSGLANSGGGGGGGSDNSGGTQSTGGNGGSGVVIVRYAVPMAWTYSMPITFTNDARLNTLTNFPALVIFDTNKVNYSQFLANGQDLRFMDSSGAELAYEVESWMSSGAPSNSYIWVKVPTLTAGCVITAYWGNASATLPAYRTNGVVWGQEFRGVWHLSETSGNAANATRLGGDGTPTSVTQDTNGVVAGADAFNGASPSAYDCGTTNALDGLRTWEAWVNPTNFTDYRNVIGKGYNAGYWFGLVLTSGKVRLHCVGGTSQDSASAVPLNQWSHIAATYDGSNMRFFINGGLDVSRAASGALTVNAGQAAHIGADFSNGSSGALGYWFPGRLDEIRVSSAVRSTNWVWAEYMNMASNTVFNRVGTVDVTPAGGAPTIANAAVSGVSASGATFNGTLVNTGSTDCAVGVLWGTSDGGTNAGAWANTNWFNDGAPSAAYTNNTSFSTNISLGVDQTCYYTYMATNTNGVTVASPSKALITGAVTLQATDAAASWAAGNTGVFSVARGLAVTNAALTVNYSIGGTAVNGTDYTTISSSVTIPAGATNATIAVSPIAAGAPGGSRTVQLTLSAGAYMVGSPSNDTVTIQRQARTIYVATNGAHDVGNSYNTWAGAATNVNAALAIAAVYDSIVVSNGAYRLTNQITVATNISVQSLSGPWATLLYRDSADVNFRICSVTHSSALVAGFVMSNGYIAAGNGGGIEQTAGTVSNCVFTRNHMEGYNGVVNVSGGLMTHCVVTNAESAHQRNIVNLGGSGIMQDCEIVASASNERYSLSMSGGIARRCRIHHNTGINAGYVYMTGGLLENCLIYSNANGSAGGVYLNGAGAAMVNCTVVGNTAPGVKRDNGAVTNSIMYGNGGGGPNDNYSGDITYCRYSCAPDLTNAAQGNISGNPMFRNQAGGDYTLQLGSPCLDTGTNGPAADYGGTARPLAAYAGGVARCDMGAYEKNGAAGALEAGFSGTPLSGMNSVTSVLTAVVAGANTTITSWSWDFNGDGTIDTNGANLAVVTNAFGLGRHSVVVSVTNSAPESAVATNANYVLVVSSNIYAAAGGGNVVPYATWADAATNVNDAVDIALAGSTVMISNGNYRIAKKIDLFTPFTIRSLNGPSATLVYRHSADPRFGLLDLRDAGALVSGITMTNGNKISSSGAALYMTAGTISNCVVRLCLNEASYSGSITMSGGLMTDCAVTNMAHWYPIMVLSGSAIVEKSLFIDNTCGESGVCQITGDSVVRRCRFVRTTGNTPYVYVTGGSLINSLVYSNSAAGAYLGPAGGVRISSGRMVNCTVTANQRTTGTASGVYQTGGVITNCIFYGNGANAPADNYSGSAGACWFTCAPDMTNGVQSNVTADPVFVNSATNNYRLQLGSPCLDVGTNVADVTTDLDGLARPLMSDSRLLSRHDMGAYELDGGVGRLAVGMSASVATGLTALTTVFTAPVAGTNRTITWYGWDFNGDGNWETNGAGLATVTNTFGPGLYTVAVRVTNSTDETAAFTNANYILVVAPDLYVATNGGHVLPYASWANAATSVNAAADIALGGCTIYVTNGVHRLTKTVNIFSDFGIRSINGPGVTTLWRSTNVAAFTMFDLRSANALLSGFTITNGGLVARSVLYMTAGLVTNCVVTSNDMVQVDRGMLVLAGGTMSRCVITNNNAFYGLGIFSGSAVVEDCRFVKNTAGQYGFIQMSGGTMRRCTIASNTASYHTAGVQMTGGRLENCLIYTNVAQSTGSADGAGGVRISGGALVNCTVVGNVKANANSPSGGGVVLSGGVITNCIMYGNVGVSVSNDYNGAASACWYTCCPQLTAGVQSNITANPLFTSLATGDLTLGLGSPCIDGGTNLAWSAADKDLAGSARLVGAKVDMGCYEMSAVPTGTMFMFR